MRPILRRTIWTALVMALAAMVHVAGAVGADATPAPKRFHPHRKPWPITLTVRMVPALSGMRITFDNETKATDIHGKVSFTREHDFRPHTLRLVDDHRFYSDRRYQFVRWAGQRDPDQAFRSTVTGLPMRMSYTIEAAFAVQRPVAISLVNMQRKPLDWGRVSQLTLRSGRAGTVTVPPNGKLWVNSVVPVYRNSGIALEDETYSLMSAIVGGTNTVDAGRQRFTPSDDVKPVFTTKFFTLRVTAHDLLFKGKGGDFARITYPDGSVHTQPFGRDGMVVAPDLPRGDYVVSVIGGGTVLPNSVVLSRNTTLDLPLATHLDYAAIAAALALIMAGLVLVGRGRRRVLSGARWLYRLLPRPRPASQESPAAPADQAGSHRIDEHV